MQDTLLDEAVEEDTAAIETELELLAGVSSAARAKRRHADHSPLCWQEKIFECAGMKLARSTLADGVGMSGVHLQPLADALRQCCACR